MGYTFDFHISGAIHVICREARHEDSDEVGVVIEIDFVNYKLVISDCDVVNFVSELLKKRSVVDFKENEFIVRDRD